MKPEESELIKETPDDKLTFYSTVAARVSGALGFLLSGKAEARRKGKHGGSKSCKTKKVARRRAANKRARASRKANR